MNMAENRFVAVRVVDEKPRWVIIDKNGKIINISPSKEELDGLREETFFIKRHKKGTATGLLEYVMIFEKEHGRTPKYLDFNNNHKYPSFNIYMQRFGSWNNAIEMTGLQVNYGGGRGRYTKEELLGYLPKFYDIYGRPPTEGDLVGNLKYPSPTVYRKYFGSLQKALKLVGLDTDSMIRKGIIETTDQKARLTEILVREHFAGGVTDLSGENKNSFADGICPNNHIYDVKSSALTHTGHTFIFDNSRKDEIEWYYLLGFNEDYTELLYVLRIPAWNFVEYIEKGRLWVSINHIEDMKQYIITEKIKPIFNNWLDNIQKK